MADDRTSVDARDRSRVAGEEAYEVDYFARKHGISRDQAKALIDRIGNNRDALDKAAQRLDR